jgi:hypothetical protein
MPASTLRRRPGPGGIIQAFPLFSAAMKTWIVPLLAALACSACATSPSHEDARLEMYRSHADAPVRSFIYLGRFDRWEALGDTAIAVWTRPHDGWLLDLGTPCLNLDYAIAIGVTSHTGQVSARIDDVLVEQPGQNIPCRIEEIRPLDDAAIRAADAAQRAQASGT